MEESDIVFPISGHPTMWPNMGFVELPVGLGFRASIASLPDHAAIRVVNHTVDKKRKKEKGDKKVRRWAKQRARMNRGKRKQGSEEEEEEEEGDSSGLPV